MPETKPLFSTNGRNYIAKNALKHISTFLDNSHIKLCVITANSDTVLTYQNSSVQLATDKKVEASNKA